MIHKKVQFLLLHTALLLCCVFVQSINAQCVTSGAQSIPDNGTLTIEFFVSGLTDSDLASPTQGVCGVNLDFMHENLGDLTIFLISPAGTIVQLIGPVTPTLVSTNLSRWNISFLPCLNPVTPDPGFADVWSNEQNWMSFAPYSGSYHPNVGCLENFSVGSANGLWQLVIHDNDPTQVGTITSASLIFCNPAGLQCECSPIGGILSPSVVLLCEGTAFNSSSISVDYGGPAPPASLYSYLYLLINGNSIINSGSSFSASPPAGTYSVCGLSYLTADSMAIDMFVDAGDYNQLVQAINAGSVCGQLTSACIDFDVLAIPDTVFINQNLCAGETFSFRGQVYSSTGIYEQMVNGPGSCDSVYVLDINISSFNVITNIPGILDCAAGSIVLDATVTGNNGPVQYQWSTNTGNIIGPTTTDQIVINQPGHYIVTVNDGQCVVSFEVDVVANDNFPKILLEGGTLTCITTSIQLSPVYVPTNGLVSWSGPMGFSSDQPVIDAVIPGTYTLTVSTDLGCSASKMVVVGIDTMTNPLNIIIVEKNCLNEFALITFSDQQRIVAVNWIGPNNYNTNTYTTAITDPGIYTLTAYYQNGCQNSTSFLFDGDFDLPSIMASADDTLNCNETIPLSVSSITPGVTFGWSGPNGFSSSQPMINVRQQGTFYAYVYADNGCRAQEAIEIINGDDIFDYQLFSDTLDCKTDTVQLGVVAPEADIFHWINYFGPDSSQSSISVTTPGQYYIMMTDTNSGCIIEANILIQTNYSYPSFGYTIDTVNCVNLVAEINFVPLGGFIYTDIYFKLPDESIVQGTRLFTNLPGEHQLIALDPAGCMGTWRIHVPFDTLPPIFYLEADTLGCDLNGDITTILFDPLTSISWTGPNMFASSDLNPMISDTGLYVATGYGENGCSTVVSVHVEADFDLPLSSIQADSLDCLSPFARLEVSSPEPILSYQWTDPFGIVISTDTFANVILPGDYIVQLEGTNHCFRADTITVLPVVYPQIRLETDTLTCRETNMPIEAIADIPNPVFGWTDLAGTSLGNSEVLNVTHSGPFIISVTGTSGCVTRDTIRVPIDTVPPVAMIELQGEVRCQFRDIVLSGVNSTPSQLDYEWSTLGGFITSNNLLPVIDARDTGLYVLQIERHGNGCRDTAQIRVVEDPNSITRVFLDIIQASCAGDSNGQIHIVALQGGVLPVFSQLDGGPPQAVGLFQGLTAGTYNLEITDAEGCKYDTMVTIIPTNPFIVDAGPDQEIYLGESFELSGTSDISVDQISIQEWDSLGFIFCQDCPLLEVTPFMTSTYIYRVISATGCILEDEVTIFVIEKGKFYIANVFTPNGDNINDEIRINAVPGIKKVRKWIIYDRWGDAVFGATDFDPDDLSIFWNGKTPDGEALNPAVFPYMLEVVLINGNTEVHHGTITLIK